MSFAEYYNYAMSCRNTTGKSTDGDSNHVQSYLLKIVPTRCAKLSTEDSTN